MRDLPLLGHAWSSTFAGTPSALPPTVSRATSRIVEEVGGGAPVLLALWSPKGGSGTSVLAATCSLVLAREVGAARLGDLDGDHPAIFGLGAEPPVGSDRLAERRPRSAERGARPARGRGRARRRAPAARRFRARARAGCRRRGGRGVGGRVAATARSPRSSTAGVPPTPRRARSSKWPTCRSSSCAAATSRCGGRCARRHWRARRVWCSSKRRTAHSARRKSATCSTSRCSRGCRSRRRSSARSTPACSRRGCREPIARPASVLVHRVGLVSVRRGAAA